MQRHTSKIPVLMYHDVGEAQGRFSRFAVPRSLIAEPLHALVDAGYQTVTIDEVARLEAPVPAQLVAITFDDAYRNLLDLLPDLDRLRTRATVFVPTAFVGASAQWLPAPADRKRPLLGWPELRALAQFGVECGSHSQSHAELDLLDDKALGHELRASRDELEQELQRPVTSFCYPHGYHNRRVRDAVAAAGYRAACAIGYRRHALDGDRYAINRLFVGPSTTPARLLQELRGRPQPRAVISVLGATPWRWTRQLGARSTPWRARRDESNS